MLLSVALLSPPHALLTYASSPWLDGFSWREGLRVAVPLGRCGVRTGLVLGQVEEGAEALPAGVTAREIIWPLERDPLLPRTHLELIRHMAVRQCVSAGQILACVLPAGLRVARARLRSLAGGKARVFSLRELAAMAAAEEGRRAELHALGEAWLQGAADFLLPSEDAAASEQCVLLTDPPWSVRPSATRQIALLDFLLDHGSLSRRELLRSLGRESAPALATLVRQGLVALRRQEDSPPEGEPADTLLPPVRPAAFALSAAQQDALDACLRELDAGKPCAHLLFGVTGSGKTAVYMELARACLERGRSALLLAPEVALACKLRRDVMNALPDAPLYFFHGYQSPQARERMFRELARQDRPCLVVGTRSALFLPIPRLGVVILDEEHDASFKQDEGLPYQAKEVAWFRARQSRGLLALGSATPDLKTFHAAREAKISLSVLPERVGGGRLPEVRLVDIRTLTDSDAFLAPESLAALKDVVARGEQAVVLLNRRGYAPLMYCLDCGRTVRCPHCDIGLTYHKGRERLVCHYCGHTMPFPSPCPNCKGLHYHPMGQGTERVEESLAGVLPPGGRVLRLDRDTTRRPGSMEAILESFARREAQVLVGTQMLSKGHHFPDVTLAVIADGDLGLNLPDYRAAERTFQLLVQSAGRAGRGDKPGEVIIQTRDTRHYCWRFVRHGDYEGFYAHEIALRERHRYPPFINLALLRVTWAADWEEGKARLARIATLLREKGRAGGVTVLGPVPAPLPLLRGRRRFHCLLKAHDWQAIRALYALAAPLASPPHLRITLDIDPVNML